MQADAFCMLCRAAPEGYLGLLGDVGGGTAGGSTEEYFQWKISEDADYEIYQSCYGCSHFNISSLF